MGLVKIRKVMDNLENGLAAFQQVRCTAGALDLQGGSPGDPAACRKCRCSVRR
jgi:hypothetical protein